MKNNKSIKILISILILILGILISTNVNAASSEYRVFYNRYCREVIEGGRLRPYQRDDFIMACIQPHSKYSATLTVEQYELYHDTYKGYDTAAGVRGHDHNSKAVAPWNGKKYTMWYTQGDKIDEVQNQDLAYILNTANERKEIRITKYIYSTFYMGK